MSPWDAVGSSSILIFESKNIPDFPIKNYRQFFKRADLYLSAVQMSSKDNFDILYSYRIDGSVFDSVLVSESWPKDHTSTSRLLNGFKIYEIKDQASEIQLAYAYLHGIFVLSRSSLLIENAIRVFGKKESKSFKSNQALFQFPSLKSDRGNVYLNITDFSNNPFFKSSLIRAIPLLSELRNLSVYDIKSNESNFSLNGFSIGENSSLKLFQNQKPVAFEIARYIPNYSTDLVHFGISDLRSFRAVVDTSFLKKLGAGGEIAFISAKNKDNLLAMLELMPGSTGDFDFTQEYNESYYNHQIRSINGEALKKGFGKIFPNALFGFSTIKDNYLFLSQSVEEMKLLLDAIENDETWGKTLEYQKFSDNGLQESNVTLIIKRPEFFSKDILSNYPGFLDSLGLSKINWSSMQMSALDNHFYSSINFSRETSNLNASKFKIGSESSFVELHGTTQFASLVKNHITESQEILVQDSDLMIYLISFSEGVMWNRKIDSEIQGHLRQIDYFKNGKLQYFFTTNNRLYLIDRLGRDVTGYPKELPASVRFSDIVDYDKNKDYRFVISSINNQVSLLDKKGSNLSDWGPKKFEEEIAYSPQHFKIGGKDHFIIISIDATIQIFNRKGERISLFKTNTKEVFNRGFYIESGLSVSTTYLHYVSSDGALVKQNLKGDVLSSENLLRGINSKFLLEQVVIGDGFHIYRTDSDKIVVFNKNGDVIFERQNSGSTNLAFQSIELNAKLLFGFYDIEQKLFHVFDDSGNSVVQTPIESDIIPLVGFGKEKNELLICSFVENSVFFTSIKR